MNADKNQTWENTNMMTALELLQWQEMNSKYLEFALQWLRLQLQLLSGAHESDETVNKEQVKRVAEQMKIYETLQPPPGLIMLSNRFGLSSFEKNLLLLCTAVEFDLRIPQLCAAANKAPEATYPTLAIAFMLFDEPSWDVMSPESPIRYWHLVELVRYKNHSSISCPIQSDERIVNYVKGVNHCDQRLLPLLIQLVASYPELPLPESQQSVVNTILDSFQHEAPGGKRIFQLLGSDSVSKRLIAWHIAHELNLVLYKLPIKLLPSNTIELERLSRLWERESVLNPVALYLDHSMSIESERDSDWSIEQFLNRTNGIFFIDSYDIRSGLGVTTLDVEISKPTSDEQCLAWRSSLNDIAPGVPNLLAGQFNLNTSTIYEILSTTNLVDQSESAIEKHLWTVCLERTRPRLDTLAQRLEPKVTWKDIVIPDNSLSLLHQITNQVRHRNKVYGEWGFRKRMNRGNGVVALFAGESGTGKTMAAEVIASDLNLTLYRIDLSAVVSKYIGETEKNLRQLFDAAEDGGAILFFDEADALFGKRSQVRDSHDRYANIETNYLLQRVEAYKGLAILSTNMRGSLDEAFTRRIRFIINFVLPDKLYRRQIWERVFPSETPIGELDYDYLSSFEMAGGNIINVALNAAFLAASENTRISMQHIILGIRSEFHKSNRLVDESAFAFEKYRSK